MGKNNIKNKKQANIVKIVRERVPKAEENITRKPTWTHLLKFTLPTIFSTLIMNTFGIVDGIFVSCIYLLAGYGY